MRRLFFVQPYRLKGARLIAGGASTFGDRDAAEAAGLRSARFRPGVVVLMQDLDVRTGQWGKPAVIAIHGQVPAPWRDVSLHQAAA